MLERRNAWSAVAAFLLFATVAAGAEGQETASTNSNSADWVAVDPIPAAKADLIVGDGYKIQIKRGEVVVPVCGDLILATEKWVVLRTVLAECEVEGIPYLMDIPVIGDLFCRHSENRESEDVWIPREAATITSHLSVEEPVALMPAPGNEPSAPAACTVEMLVGGEAILSTGQLTAIDKTGVTLQTDDTDADHAQQIAWGDILSISMPSAQPKPAEWGTADSTPAAEAQLIVGDLYEMWIQRGDLKKLSQGELVKATDKWVVLRNSAVQLQCEGIPLLMDLPLVGEFFCRYTETTSVSDCWIPREAATLKAFRHGAKPEAPNPTVGDEPPTATNHMVLVEMVEGGKLVRHFGDLTVVRPDGLTLTTGDDEGDHHRQVARHDILSIEIPRTSDEPAPEQGDEPASDKPAGQ